jgi:hypothetical protein
MTSNNKFSFIFPGLFFLFSTFIFSQTQNYNPGVDRWSIKTSVLKNTVRKHVSIEDLLKLQNPIPKYKEEYNDKRIPTKAKPGNLKEGDIITTTAWLKLVALEDDSKNHRDGDYHIQLTSSPASKDSCFIVEVPYPGFISDSTLKKECTKVRTFIQDELLKGKEPSKRGSIMIHNVYVTVKGQLFFDGVHLNEKPRGKRGMHSYTEWELHPVTDMKFAPLPK